MTVSFEQEKDQFFLLIDGQRQFYTGKYLCGTPYKHPMSFDKDEVDEVYEILSRDGEEFPFKIRNFTYNGFFGKEEKTFMKERGRFLRWSGDPGVAVMLLDSGKEKLVPTFAIPGSCLLPKDETEKVLFGQPSNSK